MTRARDLADGKFDTDVEVENSSGATLKLTSTDTTGADTELLGQIDFVSSDSSTGSAGTQARIKGVYEDNGDSSGIAFLAGASTGSGTPTISEVMRIRHEGNVGIGTTSPSVKLEVNGDIKSNVADGSNAQISAITAGSSNYATLTTTNGTRSFSMQVRPDQSNAFVIRDETGGANRFLIETGGAVLMGKTSTDKTVSGFAFEPGNQAQCHMTSTSGINLILNRQTSDGTLVQLRHADTTEGSIVVSGSTVSYNGGHLSRWSQATDGNRIDGLVKGTVMTNLDQMAEWTKDGVTEDNEQLNCMAVSSVEGDVNVAGVFVNWDDDDEDYTADMNIAMTGDMVIRIAQGTTVARGDLLMSAGDGTAKPQDDDIVRSKTIAKVTSTNKSHTYDDGSYLVPCVLMAC
tara:strand:+ start:63 stop:1271 length:1209 start_codon:yes stop_codon:yes gene_type:complete